MSAAMPLSDCSQASRRSTRPGIGVIAAVLATLLLHGAVAALLLGWQPPAPPAAAGALSVEARLIAPLTAPAPPTTGPQPLPEPVPERPSALEPPPVAKPTPIAEPPQPVVAEAALAQRRIAEQEALARAEREREQREQQRIEAERQAVARRQAEALQAQQERERAEAQQQAADAAAAASRRYEPLEKTAPDYPARALARRIEGDCTVRYTVSARGRVVDPAVDGECHPLFVMPSLAAAKRFRYQPRIVDGRAIAVAGVTNTFHYRIEAQD